MSLGFHRPSTVSEALTLQASLGDDALFLAGGTEINQKHFAGRPSHLISLAGLDLSGIAAGDGTLVLGATTSFQALIEAPDVPASLQRAAGKLVNRNVRNVATVGGQIATGKSCADLIPCLVVLGARVLLATTTGSAAVPVEDYVVAKPAGIIVAVELPWPAPQRGVGLANFTRTANDLSVLTAAASLAAADGTVQAPVLALGGVASTVVRLPTVEQAITGAPLPSREAIAALVAAAVSPIDDLRGSAAFKRQLAAQLAADVLTEAWQAVEA
jgi:putative selenate reductase FAD-binding subunit